jgi:HopA1 effector protein family
MLYTPTNQLLDSLFDIASNIEIESNFCIIHPNYQPFALPKKVADRFQQNLPALQRKYLTLLLRNFIYGIYYNGSLRNILALNAKPANLLPHQTLENNYIFGNDWEFYGQLDASNHGVGYLDSGWQVLRQEPDGTLVVIKDGLTLHVEYNSPMQPNMKSVKVGNLVAILMPKNRLQNNYYLAVSNNPDVDLDMGRIYFNLSPTGAIALMDSLTLQLNAAEIFFNFQVLYNPCAYQRYDSGVLYFQRNDYPAVRKVLQAVYWEHKSDFKPEIPLFTKFLAPGLSLAEEPSQKFAAQDNFGMNRCQIIASSLLSAWQKGDNSSEEKMKAIAQHFTELNIDLQRPYLNPYSKDIYYFLN